MPPLGPGMAPRTTIIFSSGVDLHNVEVLNGDLLNAHVTGADLALEDAAGVGGGVHGAGVAVHRTGCRGSP